MERDGVQLLIVETLALLGRRDGNFLVIACASILKNGLQVIFLEDQSVLARVWGVADAPMHDIGKVTGVGNRSRGKTRDIKRLGIGDERTNLFLGVLDTGCDLGFGSDGLVLCSINLVLPEHRKSSLDAELLDPNLARRHGAGVVEDGRKPAENPQKKSLKS